MRSMGVRRSEEQHQRERHKEVVKGGRREEKCKDGNKERREGRGGERLCVWEFFQQRNSACFCAHSECMCCNSMQTVQNNWNNDFKICMGRKMKEYN